MLDAGMREPEFAGDLYPSEPKELADYFARLLHDFLDDDDIPLNVQGVICPHDSPVFCGEGLGRLFCEITLPERVLLLHPRIALPGEGAAFSAHSGWTTPFGSVRVWPEMLLKLEKAGLAQRIHEVQDAEHSAEVLIPFLQACRHGVEVAPLAIGNMDYEQVMQLAQSIAAQLEAHDPANTLILAASNFCTGESSREIEKLDDIALEAIEALDPRGLLEAVQEHDLPLTGATPIAVMLAACRLLGCAEATVVDHADSSEMVGGQERATGYASVYVI